MPAARVLLLLAAWAILLARSSAVALVERALLAFLRSPVSVSEESSLLTTKGSESSKALWSMLKRNVRDTARMKGRQLR